MSIASHRADERGVSRRRLSSATKTRVLSASLALLAIGLDALFAQFLARPVSILDKWT